MKYIWYSPQKSKYPLFISFQTYKIWTVTGVLSRIKAVYCYMLHISESDHEMPQSHTADQPMALWGRDTYYYQSNYIKMPYNKAISFISSSEIIAKLESH